MTFPSRKAAAPTALVRIRGSDMERASLETIWRETCCEFLFACFHGAPGDRIRQLGEDVMRARLDAHLAGVPGFRRGY